MKILHTEASCGWGGQEIRILEESRGMIGRGHDLTVACPPHARIAEEARRYAVPIVQLPIEFRTFKGLVALRRHLSHGGYDMVNTHSSADSWLVALACATLPKPPAIVRTRHISAPVSGNLANRWLYRQAKMTVTTGERLRENLIDTLELDASRVVSIPTGIDTERFKPPVDKASAKTKLGLDPDGRYIGIVATLRSWKGHLDLLEAFSNLDRPGWNLLIIGDGPMREPIEKKVIELEISGRVRLVGQQNRPEDWLSGLDIFCLPSYANEGVPQAILQAMLTGLPILTTPVGSITEAVSDGETGLVVPQRAPEALVAGFHRLIDDIPLATRLGMAARSAAVGRFGLGNMLASMENAYVKAVMIDRGSTK